MKNIFTKMIGLGIIFSFLLVPVLSLRAEDGQATTTKKGPRLENKEIKIDLKLGGASSTIKKLENRENIIDRIRVRLASTTASTSAKRIENLNNRLQKQLEQMGKIRERLLEKELKVAEILGKISDKITERINLLVTKGLDLSVAKAKLAEAKTKITEVTAETDNLSILIETAITEANQTQLFTDIRVSQDKIITLAKEAKVLLVDTIKEITKVLPAKPAKTGTTTATTTD